MGLSTQWIVKIKILLITNSYISAIVSVHNWSGVGLSAVAFHGAEGGPTVCHIEKKQGAVNKPPRRPLFSHRLACYRRTTVGQKETPRSKEAGVLECNSIT